MVDGIDAAGGESCDDKASLTHEILKLINVVIRGVTDGQLEPVVARSLRYGEGFPDRGLDHGGVAGERSVCDGSDIFHKC